MNKAYKVAVLPGDGIGPEIVDQALEVIKVVSKKAKVDFEFTKGLIGGASIEENGIPLTNETLEMCKGSDAVFLGAVGDYKYDTIEPSKRPEQALLKIRKELGLFANLRPVSIYDELITASPLKPEYVKDVDIMIIRELTGGVYFGQPRAQEPTSAYNTMVYTKEEIARIARVAFDVAMKRNKKVCSVDKANVLEVSRLWRAVTEEVALEYPEVELSHMYVDNAAMQLIKNPAQFDVMLTENLFGDILSDEASVLLGSLGMLPSASLSSSSPAMYEPAHGSSPNEKGLDKVNPIATILSAAMMLKYSFNMDKEAAQIEKAVNLVLQDGFRTFDIMSEGKTLVGTSKMGKLICQKLEQL